MLLWLPPCAALPASPASSRRRTVVSGQVFHNDSVGRLADAVLLCVPGCRNCRSALGGVIGSIWRINAVLAKPAVFERKPHVCATKDPSVASGVSGPLMHFCSGQPMLSYSGVDRERRAHDRSRIIRTNRIVFRARSGLQYGTLCHCELSARNCDGESNTGCH
jgi:hypothetical protein